MVHAAGHEGLVVPVLLDVLRVIVIEDDVVSYISLELTGRRFAPATSEDDHSVVVVQSAVALAIEFFEEALLLLAHELLVIWLWEVLLPTCVRWLLRVSL